jgi:hypothetical protein
LEWYALAVVAYDKVKRENDKVELGKGVRTIAEKENLIQKFDTKFYML